MELMSHSTEETQKFAAEIAQKAMHESVSTDAIVIALEGELGAGKTTFTQGFIKSLGITEAVKSPTFLLMKHYPVGDRQIYHLDCYRINEAKELDSIEVPQLLKDPRNIILIEWPERISSLIPQNAWRIHIDHIDTEVRKITVSIPITQ